MGETLMLDQAQILVGLKFLPLVSNLPLWGKLRVFLRLWSQEDRTHGGEDKAKRLLKSGDIMRGNCFIL